LIPISRSVYTIGNRFILLDKKIIINNVHQGRNGAFLTCDCACGRNYKKYSH